MSSFAKIALGVLVVAVVAWGVWSYSDTKRTRMQEDQQVEQTPTLSSGTTNSDLDKDMDTIDSQLQVVSDSSVEIDQSMNEPSGK